MIVESSNQEQINNNKPNVSKPTAVKTSSKQQSSGLSASEKIKKQPSAMSFSVTIEKEVEVLAFTPERPEKWFQYFEQVTLDDIPNRKKYLTKMFSQDTDLKNILLDNYNSDYNHIKSAIIEAVKSSTRSVFYSVEHKMPKYRQEDVRANYRRVYDSLKLRADELPLEVLKAMLPGKIKEFVRNHEANDIERVIALAEQATAVPSAQDKLIRCFNCNKVGHKAGECWGQRYEPFRGGRGGYSNGNRGGYSNGNNRGGYTNGNRGYSNGGYGGGRGSYSNYNGSNYKSSYNYSGHQQQQQQQQFDPQSMANVTNRQKRVNMVDGDAEVSVFSLNRSSNLHRIRGELTVSGRTFCVCVLIDSGANLCLLDKKIADLMCMEICPLVNDRLKVCGSTARSLGMARADLKTGKVSERLTFDVLENVGEDAILGLEFFKLFKLWINSDLDLCQANSVLSKFGEAPKLVRELEIDSEQIETNTLSEPVEWKPNNLKPVEPEHIEVEAMSHNSNPDEISDSISSFPTNSTTKPTHSKSGRLETEPNLRRLTKRMKLEPEIERGFLDRIAHLDPKSIKCKLINLFYLIFAVFACTACDLGNIDKTEARIRFKPGKRFEKRFAFIDRKNSKLINERVIQLLRKGIIRESSAEFYSPAFLVDKKDEGEKTRLVVDYRVLNSCVEKLDYQFPVIEDIIDRLSEAKVFSCLDVSQGFYHINIADIEKIQS